jgi:hypothetical protein
LSGRMNRGTIHPTEEILGQLPMLSRTIPGEVLYLYLAVSPTAISATLIQKEKGVQKPVYFVNKALHGVNERYPQIEKLAFALVMASRKLRPYFQLTPFESSSSIR